VGPARSCVPGLLKGHQQSPLDIRNTHRDKSLQPLEFHYVAGPMTLENTGRGIIARVDPGSDMVANGIRYHLVELDFHHPSEHPSRASSPTWRSISFTAATTARWRLWQCA